MVKNHTLFTPLIIVKSLKLRYFSPSGSPVNLEVDFGDGNWIDFQSIERSRRKDNEVVAAFNEDITINHTYSTAGKILYSYLMQSYRLQNIFL